MSEVAESFRHCQVLTRRTARNFWFSFLTLPRAKREAMCVIYAWMRQLDDLADDAPSPAAARGSLAEWRLQTHAAISGHPEPAGPSLWPAFAEVARRHNIDAALFDEIIEGALMDQEVTRYASFPDLYRYCYRVASVVGLVSLRVFGYHRSAAEKAGEHLGIAFQLTNILRDVREDAARGRIYLPLDELARHGVAEADILEGRWSPGLHALLREFGDRAEEYYGKAAPVFDLVRADARPTLLIMEEIYHGILHRIREMDYRVLDTRARVSTPRKFWIVFKRSLFRRRSPP